MFEIEAFIYYNRYVGSILIVSNSSIITEEQMINMINYMHSNLLFTLTCENNNCISFLDSLISKKEDKLEMNIYRVYTKEWCGFKS
jgi:hypothetical protein